MTGWPRQAGEVVEVRISAATALTVAHRLEAGSP